MTKGKMYNFNLKKCKIKYHSQYNRWISIKYKCNKKIMKRDLARVTK